MKSDDTRWMRLALKIAARGRTRVFPNPMAGCVIVKDGRLIASGWHRGYGLPHAEAEALKIAGSRARGATAYVALEPCVMFLGKKTPSCAQALADAGAARVVYAAGDPNPFVAGRGKLLMKSRGVEVVSGVLDREGRALNADFLDRMRRPASLRPRVILKMALSLDGRAASLSGESRWITSEASRKLVGRWRAESDAVLVGIGTVLEDDPELTSRGMGRNPVRLVLDSRLRIPRRAKVLDGKAPTWILSVRKGRVRGAEVISLPASGGEVDLRAVVAELGRRRIRSVLVEGGPRVWRAFLEAGLADEVRVFIAPKLLGGARRMRDAVVLTKPALRRSGPDLLIRSRVVSRT